MIGLKNVKNEVEKTISLVSYLKKEMQVNGNSKQELPVNLNMFFLGSPRTGKKTVARIYAELLRGLELLKSGHLIEAYRSDFVGQYQGHTARKTKELCESAYGGVLFIDEAYSLVSDTSSGNDSYGQETISTLLTEMENNSDKLVVILAGYSKEMKEFIDSNSGLQSRAGKTVAFNDYSESELFEIFMSMAKTNGIVFNDDTERAIKEHLSDIYQNRDYNFVNARDVRNVYEDIC